MSKKRSTVISSDSDKFRKAVQQILSVPKAELARREGEYQRTRKVKASKAHR
jgi:hypothetical protein